MSNKTISINPSLFGIGSKTKKKKTSTVVIKPIISPNVLKNKLLKRIKEHKQHETKDLAINQKLSAKEPTTSSNYSDEFTESIQYLQTLAKQKQKNNLEKKTVKNYHSLQDAPVINIHLPEELSVEPFQPQINESEHMQIKKPSNDVPYGILKGGSKPCYREWIKTQKNNIVTNPNASLIIQGNKTTFEQNAREKRLQMLREKIKKKEQTGIPNSGTNLLPNSGTNLIPNSGTNLLPNSGTNLIPNSGTNLIPNSGTPPLLSNQHLIATKHITKKTIKRKYTLGKSHIKKTVGVLIKDKGTRKHILSAQKELRKKNINEIKTYLNDHNLIEIGSNAPSDVLRQLYESAMLSGEITNTNPHTLLQNVSKQ